MRTREKRTGKFLVFLFATAACLCLSLSATTLAASDVPKDATAKSGSKNPFFVLSNGVEGPGLETPAAKAAILAELGYDGIGPSGVEGVAEMLEALDHHNLAMHVLYIGISIDNSQKYDPRLKDVIKILKGRSTIIWLYVVSDSHVPTSPQADARVVEAVREVAAMAQDSGLCVALYPHYGFYVATVDDALRVAEKVDRKNVGITFNVCHCLRSGNGDKIPALLKRAIPRLMVVTINGADHKGDWDRLIQPLDRGEFDMLKFLKTVHQLGFTGPVGLQCYGIKGDSRQNLTRSMQAWRELTKKVNADK